MLNINFMGDTFVFGDLNDNESDLHLRKMMLKDCLEIFSRIFCSKVYLSEFSISKVNCAKLMVSNSLLKMKSVLALRKNLRYSLEQYLRLIVFDEPLFWRNRFFWSNWQCVWFTCKNTRFLRFWRNQLFFLLRIDLEVSLQESFFSGNELFLPFKKCFLQSWVFLWSI